MKKILKKIAAFLTHRVFVATVLTLGILLLIINYLFPSKGYIFIDFDDVYFGTMWASSVTKDESQLAYLNSYGEVYVVNINDDMDLRYKLDSSDKHIRDAEIYDFVFGENNQLYLIIKADDSEFIAEFDENGKYVRDVAYYESSDEYNISISDINYYDGAVHFLCVDNNEKKIALNKCENGSSAIKQEWRIDNEVCYQSNTLNLSSDGVVTVNTDLGTVGYLDKRGYHEILRSDFNIIDNEFGILPNYTISLGDDTYLMACGMLNPELLFVDTEEIYTLATSDDLYSYYESAYFTSLEKIYDSIVFTIDDSMYVMDDDFEYEEYYQMRVSWIDALIEHIKPFVLPIALVLIIIGSILLIGNLMKWHFNLLTKQLFIILPLILVMNISVSLLMVRSLRRSYYDNIENQVINIGSIVASQLSGDVVESIVDFSYVENGLYYEMVDFLTEMSEKNRLFGETFTIGVYRDTGKGYQYLLADDYSPFGPFGTISTFLDVDVDTYLVDGSDTYILNMYTLSNEYISGMTPIYNSDGDRVAYIDISANLEDCERVVSEIIAQNVSVMALFMSLLTVAVSIVCIINVRYLKKASNMVSSIAGGDFSVKIDKTPKDEVGTICRGITDMAHQLEEYFVEKDKNEKFYYKFVPEKFKELLHKEEFTDLSLGDAESLNLTVLFCDIRSFSLNSEMMTAKENFEFVNKIYGIAGPIVRKHGGFVDKYIGDAVMALFEKADMAVDAGIEMYHAIALDPACAESLGVASINIGIGIHTGMARIGIVGEEERMAGTVISDTVNLSSRLEGLTKQYKTAMLISKDTLDNLDDPDRLDVRYLGMIQVAGVNEVKAIYEVLDCLDDDNQLVRRNSKRQFREAIKEFHLGNQVKAAEMLKEIKVDSSLDPVPQKYIDYIEEKISNNDQEHNVFKFEKK